MSTLDEMRDRYWELVARKEAIAERMAPVRAELDALRAQECELKDRMKPLKEKRRTIEGGESGRDLVDIEEELAVLSRGLGRKLGPRPERSQ